MYKYIVLRLEDLEKEEIRKAVSEKKVVLMVECNEPDTQLVIDNAMRAMRDCREHLCPGLSMRNVRVYLNAVLEANRGEFVKKLCQASHRDKYLCILLGAMLKKGVFVDTPQQLAKSIHFSTKSKESLRRYIADGMEDLHLAKIFQLADKSITENPTDLCDSLTNKRVII